MVADIGAGSEATTGEGRGLDRSQWEIRERAEGPRNGEGGAGGALEGCGGLRVFGGKGVRNHSVERGCLSV